MSRRDFPLLYKVTHQVSIHIFRFGSCLSGIIGLAFEQHVGAQSEHNLVADMMCQPVELVADSQSVRPIHEDSDPPISDLLLVTTRYPRGHEMNPKTCLNDVI